MTDSSGLRIVTSTTSPLDAALGYAERGWRVMPIHAPHDSERCTARRPDQPRCACAPSVICSCLRPDCGSPAKHPRTARGLTDASCDLDQIRRWWGLWPAAGVAIVTGAESGLVVLDVDPRHGGDTALQGIESSQGATATLQARTGGGGRHLLFAHPGGRVPNSAGRLGSGLDVRGDGGYVVAAPSRHVSGGAYEWIDPGVPVAPAPAWLLERSQGPDTGPAPAIGDTIAKGGRNQLLASLAGSMRRRNASEAGILAALLAENASRCVPPLPEREVAQIAHSVARYQPAQEREEPPPPGDSLAPPDLTAAYVDPDRRTIAETRSATPADDLQRLAPSIGDSLPGAMDLMARRAAGLEKPIPTPWPVINSAIGGGFWPGAHVVTGSTAAGKTALVVQMAVEAAYNLHPVLYVALELDSAQLIARIMSICLGKTEEHPVMWSQMYLGKDPQAIERCKAFAEHLAELPIRIEEGPPGGWCASVLERRIQAMRAVYPEATKTPMVILDFLQLVGTERDARRAELRERIGTAAYAGRQAARSQQAVVIMLSSISRAASKELGLLGSKGELGSGDPADFVGMGKESGDIEFSADTVLAMAKEPKSEELGPSLVHIAIAKQRAGPPAWRLLEFNGSWFSEPRAEAREDLEARHQDAKAGRSAAREAAKARAQEVLVDLVVALLSQETEPLGRDRIASMAGARGVAVSEALETARMRGLVRRVKDGFKVLGWICIKDALSTISEKNNPSGVVSCPKTDPVP